MKGENAQFLLGVTLVTEKEKYYCHKYKLQNIERRSWRVLPGYMLGLVFKKNSSTNNWVF